MTGSVDIPTARQAIDIVEAIRNRYSSMGAEWAKVADRNWPEDPSQERARNSSDIAAALYEAQLALHKAFNIPNDDLVQWTFSQ